MFLKFIYMKSSSFVSYVRFPEGGGEKKCGDIWDILMKKRCSVHTFVSDLPLGLYFRSVLYAYLISIDYVSVVSLTLINTMVIE